MKSKFSNTFFKKKVSNTAFAYALLLTILFLLAVSERFTSLEDGVATLILDTESEKKMFQGQIVDEMTILDAINASTLSGNITFRYALKPDNTTEIFKLNGKDFYYNRDSRFLLNSKEIPIEDINKIRIKPGDRIEINLR